MKPGCGPIKFDDQDWSRFDFSRWHLDSLRLDDPSAALANLAQQLFASPEWRQNFAATLPALKASVLQYFEQRTRELQAEAADLTRNLEERTASTRKQITAFQDRIRSAATPPVLTADPNTFQLGAKVLAEESRLGLPELQVRVTDPRQKDRPLAEGITDLDGNAVLYLTKEQAEELAHGKVEVTVEVLSPTTGKPLHRTERAFCPRPNHTETRVAALPASPDLEPYTAVANQTKTERESRLASLNTKIDRLQADHDTMQHGIKCHLDEAKSILDAIKEELKPGPQEPPGEAPPPGRPTPPEPTTQPRPGPRP